jgi:hypothetical protein
MFGQSTAGMKLELQGREAFETYTEQRWSTYRKNLRVFAQTNKAAKRLLIDRERPNKPPTS